MLLAALRFVAAMLAASCVGVTSALTPALAPGLGDPPAPPPQPPGAGASADGATLDVSGAGPSRSPRRPFTTKCELLGGAILVAEIRSWDREGVDATVEGSKRRITWDELDADATYRLGKRLIEGLDEAERRVPTLALLAHLLSRTDADAAARRARDDAKRLKATDDELALVAAHAESLRQARSEAAGRVARAKLRSGSPEAFPFASYAWTKQSSDERGEAVAQLKRRTTEMLAATGRELTPIDGTQVLVYSAVSLADGARRATEIEAFIQTSLPRLGLGREDLLWDGKLVVLVSDDRDRFTLLEASAFKQEVRPEDRAIAHYDSGFAFVHLAVNADEVALAIDTNRAVALALLHRLHSAARLPPWAHEGLADWLVATYRPTKSHDAALRTVGLPQVRGAGGFRAALTAEYKQDGWPFADDATRGAAYVFASYLAEKHHDAFLEFLRIVKGGEPWQGAFSRAFHMPFERMADVAWEYHRVND